MYILDNLSCLLIVFIIFFRFLFCFSFFFWHVPRWVLMHGILNLARICSKVWSWSQQQTKFMVLKFELNLRICKQSSWYKYSERFHSKQSTVFRQGQRNKNQTKPSIQTIRRASDTCCSFSNREAAHNNGNDTIVVGHNGHIESVKICRYRHGSTWEVDRT